jgi:hypothetical protein
MADAGYSGTPLAAKLGVKPGCRLLIDRAPDGWSLPGSPVEAHLRPGRDPYDVIVLFCLDRSVLEQRYARLAVRLTVAGALWVCWPKKSSGLLTDVTENGVREYGLAAGLVDVKIAAIDATWSGLKFVRRLKDR